MKSIVRCSWTSAPLVLALLAASAMQAQETGPLNTSFIPAEAVAAMVVHPQNTLASIDPEQLPPEEIKAKAKEAIGIDPFDIAEVTAVVTGMGEGGAPPSFGLIVRTTKPYTLDEVLPVLREKTEAATFNERPYRRALQPTDPSYIVAGRTLIVADERMMQMMAKAKGASSPLLSRLAKLDSGSELLVVVSVDSLRDEIAMAKGGAPELPPPFGAFLTLPDLISIFELDVRGTENATLQFRLHGNDESSAAQVEDLLNQALQLAKGLIGAQAAGLPDSDDPAEQMQKAAMKFASEFVNAIPAPKRTDTEVSLTIKLEVSEQMQDVIRGAITPLLPGAPGNDDLFNEDQ